MEKSLNTIELSKSSYLCLWLNTLIATWMMLSILYHNITLPNGLSIVFSTISYYYAYRYSRTGKEMHRLVFWLCFLLYAFFIILFNRITWSGVDTILIAYYASRLLLLRAPWLIRRAEAYLHVLLYFVIVLACMAHPQVSDAHGIVMMFHAMVVLLTLTSFYCDARPQPSRGYLLLPIVQTMVGTYILVMVLASAVPVLKLWDFSLIAQEGWTPKEAVILENPTTSLENPTTSSENPTASNPVANQGGGSGQKESKSGSGGSGSSSSEGNAGQSVRRGQSEQGAQGGVNNSGENASRSTRSDLARSRQGTNPKRDVPENKRPESKRPESKKPIKNIPLEKVPVKKQEKTPVNIPVIDPIDIILAVLLYGVMFLLWRFRRILSLLFFVWLYDPLQVRMMLRQKVYDKQHLEDLYRMFERFWDFKGIARSLSMTPEEHLVKIVAAFPEQEKCAGAIVRKVQQVCYCDGAVGDLDSEIHSYVHIRGA